VHSSITLFKLGVGMNTWKKSNMKVSLKFGAVSEAKVNCGHFYVIGHDFDACGPARREQ
jgi:hypothetical protein